MLRGLTQEQLGNMVGLGNKAISALESGQNYPRLEVLVELSLAFEVGLDELVFGPRDVVEGVAGKSYERVHLDRLLDKLVDDDLGDFIVLAQRRVDKRDADHINATGSS